MEFELKPLTEEGVPRALKRALRYRLLGEPEQAESICRDILRVHPDHREALINLLLALTDQFSRRVADRVDRAFKVVERLEDEYERRYYTGIVWERQARAKLRQEVPGAGFDAFEKLRQAMNWYEKAAEIRPSGNDDAILRWNSCARTIMERSLHARPEEEFKPMLE